MVEVDHKSVSCGQESDRVNSPGSTVSESLKINTLLASIFGSPKIYSLFATVSESLKINTRPPIPDLFDIAGVLGRVLPIACAVVVAVLGRRKVFGHGSGRCSSFARVSV